MEKRVKSFGKYQTKEQVMDSQERDRCHREGRGEMKFDVFKEIEQIRKELDLNPNMDVKSNTQYKRALAILEKRIQKL